MTGIVELSAGGPTVIVGLVPAVLATTWNG